MASIKVVLRQKKNKDGSYPLALRITKDRKTGYIYLGKHIKLSEWDAVSHRVKSKHKNSKRLNNFLLNRLSHANDVLLELESLKPDFSLLMLKNKITRKTNSDTFFAQADMHFDIMRKEGNYNRYSAEKGAINHFRRFVKGRDITFQDITIQLMEQFKAYLKGEIKVSERTAINYLIVIRTIFNRAIKAGIVDQIHYPFGSGKIRLRRPESQKIGLEKEEVLLLEAHEFDVNSFLHHSRNVWLCSFYLAGARASDVLLLRWSDIKKDRLFYTMNKNQKVGSLKIAPKVEAILAQYRKNQVNNDDLVFPDMKGVSDFKDKERVQRQLKYRIKRIDKALKTIAKELKLNKPLSMHIARHTFGNIAGDKIPIQKLQQLYRHSNITTTVNYQKAFLYKGTDDALDAVLDY